MFHKQRGEMGNPPFIRMGRANKAKSHKSKTPGRHLSMLSLNSSQKLNIAPIPVALIMDGDIDRMTVPVENLSAICTPIMDKKTGSNTEAEEAETNFLDQTLNSTQIG